MGLIFIGLPAQAQQSNWPIPQPTDEQIEAARECNPHAPQDPACELAAEVLHYTTQTPIPLEGKQAFRRLVETNPAMAFLPEILLAYLPLDEAWYDAPLQLRNRPLKTVEMRYTYGSHDLSVEWAVILHVEDSEVRASGWVDTAPWDAEDSRQEFYQVITPEAVMALPQATVNMLPMRGLVEMVACTDHYPDWWIRLIYRDNAALDLMTLGTTVFPWGGPWQAKQQSHHYLQFGDDLTHAVVTLAEALELPLGRPDGEPENCVLPPQYHFEMAYPQEKP